MIICRRLGFFAALCWASASEAQTTGAVQWSCPNPSQATLGSTTPTSTPATDISAGFYGAQSSTPCYFDAPPYGTTAVNQAQCGAPISFNIQWAVLPSTIANAPAGRLQVYTSPTDGDCASYAVPAATDFFYDETLEPANETVPEFPGGVLISIENGLQMNTAAIMNAAGCCDPTNSASTEVGGPCDGQMFDLCVAVENDNTTPANQANAYMQFWVDTVPPAAVGQPTATGGDEQIVVSWPASTGVATYTINVYVTPADGGALGAPVQTTTIQASTGTLSTTIGNLTNGVTYTVTVSASDYANNQGPASPVATATTRDSCDFWECYGGKEKGGFCFISTAAYGSYDAATTQIFRDFRDEILLKFGWGRAMTLAYYKHGVAPAVWLASHSAMRHAVAALLFPVALAASLVVRAGPVTVLGLCALMLVLWFVLRGRARAALLLGMLLLYSPKAQAEDSDADHGLTVVDEPSAPPEKGRPRFGINVKAGTYRPNIDSDPAANGEYAFYFGKSQAAVTGPGRKLVINAEGDLYLLRVFGLLGISGGISYWTATSNSRLCVDSAGNPTGCTPATFQNSTAAVDKTVFTMVPLSLSAVYKLDYFLERWKVPLVPFVRGGIDCYFWFIQGSGRQSVKPEWQGKTNVKGLGATFGYDVRPGLAINLDWVEPDSSRRAFQTAGIFSSALTFEWVINRIDNFGSAQSWDLSDSSFLAGIEIDL